MFSIVYASSATTHFSPAQLAELLAQCRAHNSAADVTGMLLYKHGNFMQVLEGEEETVRALFTKIGRDPRHLGVLTLLAETLPERQFPDWSMGFRDLKSPDVLSMPGYNEFMNTELTGTEFSTDPTRCQKLLTIFKKMM